MTEQNLKGGIGQSQNLFSPKKIIGQALNYWYLYVLSIAVCVSYAWFTVHYATPMYKVYGQILVQDDKNTNGTSQALAGNGGGLDFNSLFSGKTNMANEIAIFQTTDLCKQVVRDMKLFITYYHKGSVRQVELYKGNPFNMTYKPNNDTIHPAYLELNFPSNVSNRFFIKAGGKKFTWHLNDTLLYDGAAYCFTRDLSYQFDTTASYIVQVQDPDDVAVGISGNLGADLLSTKSTIVNLVYNTNLPQKGVDVLGGVMRAYINRNLDQKNTTSDSTLKFIDERVALVGGDLGNIESTIQNFKQQNKITNLESQSQQLVSNSTIYYQKLSDLDVQLQVIQTMLSYVQNEQNERRPVPALLNGDPTFSQLVNTYNSAQVQRDKLLLSLKPDNPLTSNLDLQIAGLRSDMIKSLRSQQEALGISRRQIVLQNNELSGLIRNVPEQERRFLDYTREQNVKQALYLFLLQRREEIAIARASNASNASIISSPKANYIPYAPVGSTAITIGLIIGFMLPTSFVLIKYFLNNKVTSRDDITDATPATILSEIGHSTTFGMLNMVEEGRSLIAEQFRIFRTNMDFALADVKSPVVMITSCVSGEGKSFVAANLGQIYAVSGKRVLLMELDLRRPKLSGMLGIEKANGFSNYIISDSPVTDFIQQVGDNPSLFILPSGPVPPNPAELLLSEKMTKLMGDLRQQFDLIVIDTAPIGAVTDAQIIGRLADVSLYIIRQGYSIKNSIELVNDIIVNNKLSSLYIVLNDVKAGSSYKYGYGYGYGYGGYGYVDTNKKRKWWQWRK